MEDPAHSSFSPAGFSCLHVPWMCSGSQGAGCSGEGMLTSSATGIMIFLKALWLPWAHTHTHTHLGEEAHTGISSLAVGAFGREEGEAHAPVHPWVTTSNFLPRVSLTKNSQVGAGQRDPRFPSYMECHKINEIKHVLTCCPELRP